MTASRRTASPPPAGRPGAARNRLRIIGGDWRSRLLRFPDAAGLRPTPDRVRETLFNWLGQRLDGLACVDLFAGSGALGLEAKSRGAARVTMIERDRRACEHLRQSVETLGARDVTVIQGDALASLARAGGPFDVAFVDPPYASGLAVPALKALEPHLVPGARVYVESAEPVLPPSPDWTCQRDASAGAVKFALFAYRSGASPAPEKP